MADVSMAFTTRLTAFAWSRSDATHDVASQTVSLKELPRMFVMNAELCKGAANGE